MATEGDKIGKKEAAYRAFPNHGDCCVRCTMIRLPDRCTTVRGQIAPHGWCEYFEPRRQAPFARASSARE